MTLGDTPMGKLTTLARKRPSRPLAITLALTCLALSACTTAPKNPLTAEQRRDLGIDVVEINLRSNAPIWWGEAERDYARSQGCEPEVRNAGSREVSSEQRKDEETSDCDYSALVNSPEAKAYVEKRAKDVLKKHFERSVATAFTGPDPAAAVVDIKQIHIVSGMQALLVGGSHILKADFHVKDRVDGRILATYRDIFATGGYAPGGIASLAFEAMADDAYERLSGELAVRARDWLKAKE